jgi:hypothetical protein
VTTEEAISVDTKKIEMIAEEAISSALQQAGMLVAKPKFDVDGTDLVVFAEMKDGVKFCRIQCKGRTLDDGGSSIVIPSGYVTNGFIVVVCILVGQTQGLYCFFASDIRRWVMTADNEYRLYLSKTKYESELSSYLLDEFKIRLIARVIQAAETAGEFRSLVYGRAQIIEGSDRADFHGDCVGGVVLDPPLEGFPLLVYAPSQWGEEIHTEDGKVSVPDAAAAFTESFDTNAVAAKFGTTAAHIADALKYAHMAGPTEIKNPDQ